MEISLFDLLNEKNIGKKFKVSNCAFNGENYLYIVREDSGVIELYCIEDKKEITINNKTINFKFKEILELEKVKIKYKIDRIVAFMEVEVESLDKLKGMSDKEVRDVARGIVAEEIRILDVEYEE